MASGRTSASNSSALTRPVASASSRKLVPFCMRGLGDLRRVVVADPWRKRRNEHQGSPHQPGDPPLVRNEPFDTMPPEAVHGVGEKRQAFEKREGNDRLIDIEFEMALRSGKSDRRLIAEDARADHGQRLGLGRIDLAWHDRRTRFVFRQDQFPDAAAGAARREPDIIGDLARDLPRSCSARHGRRALHHAPPAPRTCSAR